MARELEGYRDCLEDLCDYFGGKRLLYPADVAKYLGVDPRTAKARYDIPKDGIVLPMLARRMAAK